MNLVRLKCQVYLSVNTGGEELNKNEVLKMAQREKVDEGRKYMNDFALATSGAFAFIVISLLIVYKIVINEGYSDLLSLLIGMVGAFCYGKFVLSSNKAWLVASILVFLGAFAVFIRMVG